MSLLDTINKNYKINKQPLETKGLQDSNYWDGLWIRPYLQEYLSDGTINPEFSDWRAKPFGERGYFFLGHGNGLSFNMTGENTEVVVDSTKEKLYLKGSSGLEISVELVNKFSKLFAKLGVSGTILNKAQPVTNLALGSVQTPAPTPATPPEGRSKSETTTKAGVLSETTFEISSSIETILLKTLSGLKFAYGADPALTLTRVNDVASLADDTFFIDQKENKFLIKLSATSQKAGTLGLSYTGDVEEVIVGFGGESKDLKSFNIVQIYNDPATGKVSYREAFKCAVSPARNMGFRGQNATDGGSTQSVTFTASEDVTRPAGEQLFIEKDDWDLSLSS